MANDKKTPATKPSKPVQRKKKLWVSITPRDEGMFKYLANGASSLEDVWGDLFSKKYSPETLKKRLNVLAKFDYLKSDVYPPLVHRTVGDPDRKTGKLILYALDECGANYLCEQLGYRKEGIRNILPSRATLGHDLG